MTGAEPRPTVSVILPTYNRAAFLPQAVDAIRAQTLGDWELIVVDDGSTDDTPAVLGRLTAGLGRPVRSVRQANQGAYGARNAGLDLARGRYVAFYDSDDLWLPHHLADCVAALEANPGVDWVYGACRRVHHATGEVLTPNSFYVGGRPRPFLRLRYRAAGGLRVIDDVRAVRCQLRHGFYCGLQNSVIRAGVFDGYRFRTHFRNEAEDVLTVIRSLAAGRHLAYLDNVHVVYRVHEANSSAAAQDGPPEKRLAVLEAQARGYEELRGQVPLTRGERRALDRRLGHDYFWEMGYALLWRHGRRREALAMFRRGLRLWPWDVRCWKTYLLARLRAGAAAGPRAAAAGAG